MMSLATDILSSFSIPQLRSLALAMGSRGVSINAHKLKREALIAKLRGQASNASLSLFAHRIEAITPYKHLFVYSLAHGFTFVKAVETIEKAFPGILNNIRDIQPHVDELDAEACVVDDLKQKIYLKLVHQVQITGWVSVSSTQKELKTVRRRHPVVVTFRPLDQLMTIGFPGFSHAQGMQQQDRMSYAEIASNGVDFIRTHLNIDSREFMAKPAIDALLEEESNRVIDIRRSVRPKHGGKFAFDAGEENKLTTALTEFLTQEGDIDVSERQIRALLRRSSASDILLAWTDLHILTRVALFEHASEVLFIWRDSGPSSTAVDSVLETLTRYENFVLNPGVSSLRAELDQSPLGFIARVPVVAQHHGVSQRDALQVLNAAVVKGQFQPRFRVNTDGTLLEFRNDWRSSPLDFPGTATCDDGSILDLRLPSNIEMAFERVK